MCELPISAFNAHIGDIIVCVIGCIYLPVGKILYLYVRGWLLYVFHWL